MTMPVREVPAGLTAEQALILASQQTYAAQQEALRAQLAAALAGIWVGVASAQVFSPQAAAKFVAQLLPVSIGAQRAMAALTVAQLNADVAPPRPIVVAPELVTGPALRNPPVVSPARPAQAGQRPRPPSAMPAPAARRGRPNPPPEDYYERPFREIKWRLSQGMPLGQAIDAGRRRAESIALTDLQLAHTRTAREYLRQVPEQPLGPRGTLQGFRRVLSNRPNHCALCILASTQRYHRDDLMPIHPNCGCTVAPIFSEDRVGQVIDRELAERVHEVVRRDLGEDYVDPGGRLGDAHYRDIIITNDHGELGPILGVRGHHFERDPSRPGRLANTRVNPADQPEDRSTDGVLDLDAL